MKGPRALWILSAFVVPGALAAPACGGESDGQNGKPHDGGADGDGDAAADAKLDAKVDAKPDAPSLKPGLGEACDGVGTNPSSCQSGLKCYQGDSPGDDPERWPGGYCTSNCASDATCKSYGGVCVQTFQGSGRCMVACKLPSDCRQGYACRGSASTNELACIPSGFVATRGPGEACFQHDDPNAAHYLPALGQSHFAANQQFDNGFFTANEIALSVSASDAVVAGANALAGGGYSNPAWYGAGPNLPVGFNTSLGPNDSSPNYSDPFITSGQDGTFYYSTLGLDFSQSAKLLVGNSSDQGKTWDTVKANPDSDCTGQLGGPDNGPCIDHPWLAVGPDKLNPTGEALYAAYLASRVDDYATVIVRSVDGGKTWGIPGAPGQSLAVFSQKENQLFTNLITPVVDEQGDVHMVATSAVSEPKGSAFNSIQYSRSEDGGATRTQPVRVNPASEPVPFEQAAMGVDSGTIWVAYVRGGPDGAWDIMLAKSTDGGASFGYEQVNDEPEPCATHFHPAIAVDRTTHKVYVAWYDGRFAPYEGSVALSVCDPAASGKQCGPNEAVSDKPFFVTTDRNDLTFIGDYMTLLARPNSTVWAGFGATVSFVSHGFVAKAAF